MRDSYEKQLEEMYEWAEVARRAHKLGASFEGHRDEALLTFAAELESDAKSLAGAIEAHGERYRHG
jgi:hypothetical protein